MCYLESMMMNWKFLKWLSSGLLLGLVLTGCQSDYTKMVKSELAKGVRQDSVLLGIKLGNTRQEFYGKCYDLNKEHLIMPGAGGNAVQYEIMDSLFHKQPTKIILQFVPAFDNKDVITNIDMKLNYPGWASGNESYQSDSLKIKVMALLMKWYGGNEFVTAKVGEEEIPAKVDGNRRILIYVKDKQNVQVKVQDILHPKFMHSISAKPEENNN